MPLARIGRFAAKWPLTHSWTIRLFAALGLARSVLSSDHDRAAQNATNTRYLTMRIRRIWPGRTCHFNPPNRTARIQALLRFDEGRSPARDNPDFGIGRLFA